MLMRLDNFTSLVAFVTFFLALPMCRAEVGEDVAESQKTYQVRGVLKSVDVGRGQAEIAHEEIPGYMGAMTMSFDVGKVADLKGLEPGATLRFTLCVTHERAWIEQLRKIAAVEAPVIEPAPPSATPREVSAGQIAPDATLKDHLGKTIALRDFRGQALAITFIYTRCPLPTYCPLMNRNFQTAQDLLGRLDLTKRCHFLSISLDPAHDTPDVLRAYAESYHADAEHWSFATGEEASLRELATAVGLRFTVVNGQITHNLCTLVVDTEGRIQRIYRGNSWTAQDLAAAMRAAL